MLTCQSFPRRSSGQLDPNASFGETMKWHWRPIWPRFDPAECRPISSEKPLLKNKHLSALIWCVKIKCNKTKNDDDTSDEDLDRVSIPRPPFKLPSGSHDKDGDDAVPIGRRQLLRRIDDAIRNGQIALFAALQQYFIVSPAALLSLVFRTQKSV